MPQISKIRIVNFNYNDGNRLIADELYDFADSSGKKALNTLINLKNGGGKSVLVQLMLQPIHPKAKTNERKIESFFTKATDHCFVVIEWLKDNSDEKLLTGIAMASGESSNNEEAIGRPVKYYTFLSNYVDYTGKYNIISLPLSRKENGSFVAAAFEDVRKLAKGSYDQLKTYSSDSSKEWRNDLADYGIIQEEWTHIIEKVNSVEGGMTKYFEGYKDSKQLLDRLLIPTIEGKFGQSTGKDEDSSLGTMLWEHSKAYLRQKDLIEERAICDEFVDALKELDEMSGLAWNANEAFEKQLEIMTAFRVKLKSEAERLETSADNLESLLQELQREISRIDYEKVSEEFYTVQDQFEIAKRECQEIEVTFENVNEHLSEVSHLAIVYRCAEIYQSLIEIRGKLSGIQKAILEKTEGSEMASKIKNIAFTVRRTLTGLQLVKTQELSEKEAKQSEITAKSEKLLAEKGMAIQAYEDAKISYERSTEAYRIAANETDKLVNSLGIESIRYFDGTYHEEELEKERVARSKQLEKLATTEAKKIKEKLTTKARSEQLGEDILAAKRLLDELETNKKQLEEEYQTFSELLFKAKGICELYNASEQDLFNGFLMNQIGNLISATEEEKISLHLQKSVIQEEIEAAEHGYVHVPKRVVDYLENKGVVYQTCEYYLGSLMAKAEVSKDTIANLLKKYPEVAFGIILEEKEKSRLFAEERNIYDWLPALVPVFDHEQLDLMLSGNLSAYPSFAYYSEAYFFERTSFIAELKRRLEKIEDLQSGAVAKLEKLEAEKEVLLSISEYNETSEVKYIEGLRRTEAQIENASENINRLNADKKACATAISEIEEALDSLREEKRGVEKWLEKFSELSSRLDEENDASKTKEEAYFEEKKKKDECAKAVVAYESCAEELSQIVKNIEEISGLLQEYAEKLNVVGDIDAGEIVEGDWRSLFEEYTNLMSSLGKELETLQAQESLLLEQVADKEKSLHAYSLHESEYVNVEFVESTLTSLVEDEAKLTSEKEKLNKTLMAKRETYARLETKLEDKKSRLEVYGGCAVERAQIMGDYAQRKQKATLKRNETEQQQKDLQKRIREIEKTENAAMLTLDIYGERNASVIIELEDNLVQQHESIKGKLKAAKVHLDSKKEALLECLLKRRNDNKFRLDEKQIFDRFDVLIKNKEFKGDRYFSLTEQIGTVIQTTKLRASQIDTDLNEFNQSKTDLLRHCVLQGKRIYDGLRSMSKNSSVIFAEGKGKRQMLRINIPDNIDAGVAENSVSTELDKGIQEVVELIRSDSADADIKKTVNRIVSSATLFRKYVNQDNVSVEVFKIDINPENAKYRTWEATQVNNSGGEKLVLYFAVILSLMNYSRSEYGDIQDKSLTSVLILDNPFGPVSSEHLLRPMFNIAEHFRVQLICLSDLDKAAITSCFDSFIKAKIETRKYSNKEMLTHEGNERIEHGYYRSEQMSMF